MPGPAQPYSDRVFVAPLAVIVIGGQKIGKLQNINITENYTRIEVRSLGEIYTQEIPLTAVSCSFTAQAAVIDLNGLGDVGNPFWPHNATTSQEFANTILLGNCEVNIEIYSKYATTDKTQVFGDVVTVGDIDIWPMGLIVNAVLDSRSFSFVNDQVTMQNISGRYLRPMMIYGSRK
jgi:hypothetical protein